MAVTESISIGVVLEQRKIDNPWQDYSWHPVAVLPGVAPASEWRLLRQGEGWSHHLVPSNTVELNAKTTEGYRVNLSNPTPMVYVVLRPGEEIEDHDVEVFLTTVCPHEAEGYMESGDEIVEGVPMPDDMISWVQAFVDAHHVDQPFIKRKRKAYDPRKGERFGPGRQNSE